MRSFHIFAKALCRINAHPTSGHQATTSGYFSIGRRPQWLLLSRYKAKLVKIQLSGQPGEPIYRLRTSIRFGTIFIIKTKRSMQPKVKPFIFSLVLIGCVSAVLGMNYRAFKRTRETCRTSFGPAPVVKLYCTIACAWYTGPFHAKPIYTPWRDTKTAGCWWNTKCTLPYYRVSQSAFFKEAIVRHRYGDQ